MTLRAYAKINPFLAVGPIRPDGYHELRTQLQLIALHDTITVTPNGPLAVECSDPALSGERNLAWKAIRLLSEAVEIPPVRIRIEKRIPAQAGLGGGSSDAAAVLVALNRMLEDVVPAADLLAIASACGADVPFFVARSVCAWAGGVGDILADCDEPMNTDLIIAMPSVGTPTSSAYALLDQIESRNRSLEGFPFRNDFELVAATESLTLIGQLKELGASHAQLCGSGSAVFGVVQDGASALEIAAVLAGKGIWAVPTRTLCSREDEA